MEVVNISNIKNNDLVSSDNPIPINFLVFSSTRPRAIVSIYHCFSSSDVSSSNLVISNLQSIIYRNNGNSYYFTIDVSEIIRSVFKDGDDKLQASKNWILMEDCLEDFVVRITVNATGETQQILDIPFTALKMSKQFGENNVLSTISEQITTDDNIISLSDKKLNQDEFIYCANDNVVYIYAITSDDSAIITENINLGYYFVDYDDVYFTAYNGYENVLTKEI